MDQLVVDFVALRAFSGHIAKQIGQFEANLTQLSEVVRDTAEAWHGEASEAYLAYQSQWFEAANDIRAQLEGLRRLITTAHDNHAKAVTTNVAIWRNA